MREALVWNFEDDNFTWMDASSDMDSYLEPVVCVKYQPDPGWQVTWANLDNNTDVDAIWPPGTEGPLGSVPSTWGELQTAGTKWSDLTSGAAEQNVYWLTRDGVMLADQAVKVNGIKEYFVERLQIDLNDIVESFTTSKWIYAKQLYFHLMSPRLQGIAENTFCIAMGWTNSLMDLPDFPPAPVINLQAIATD